MPAKIKIKLLIAKVPVHVVVILYKTGTLAAHMTLAVIRGRSRIGQLGQIPPHPPFKFTSNN